MESRLETSLRIVGVTLAFTLFYLSLLCGPPLMIAGMGLVAQTLAGG